MRAISILLIATSIVISVVVWRQKAGSHPSLGGNAPSHTGPIEQPRGQPITHSKIQTISDELPQNESIQQALQRIEKMTDSFAQEYEFRKLAPFVPPAEAEFFLDQVVQFSPRSYFDVTIKLGSDLLEIRNSRGFSPEKSSLAVTYAQIIKSSFDKNDLERSNAPAVISKRLYAFTNNSINENIDALKTIVTPEEFLEFTTPLVGTYPANEAYDYLIKNPVTTLNTVWSGVFYQLASKDPLQALQQLSKVPQEVKQNALSGLERGWSRLDSKGYTAWKNQGN